MVLSCLMLVFFSSAYFYVDNLHHTLFENFKTVLKQRNIQIADDIGVRIRSKFMRIETIAENEILRNPASTIEQKLEFLHSYTNIYRVGDLFVADEKGVSHGVHGNSFNAGEDKYFQNAMHGVTICSNTIVTPEDPMPFVAYAVPIYEFHGSLNENSQIIGAIITKDSTKKIYDAIVTRFDTMDDEHIFLLDGNGFIVDGDSIGDENFIEILAKENNISVEEARKKLRKTHALFKLDGIETDFYITPLQSTEWYVITSIPTSQRPAAIDEFINMTVNMFIVVFGILVLCVCYILFLRRKHKYSDGIAKIALEIPCIYYVAFDAKGNVRYVNTSLSVAMGWEKGTYPKTLAEFIEFTDDSTFAHLCSQKAAFQLSLQKAEGEQIYTRWHILPQKNATEWHMLGTDFSEYYHQETERLRTILDESPVSVILSDNGTIAYANRKFQQLTGLNKGDYVYDSPAFTSGDIGDLQTIVQEKRFIRDIPICVYTPQGEYRHLSLTVLTAKNTNEPQTLTWALDVTEMHEAHKELIAARNTAELAVQVKNDFLISMGNEIHVPIHDVLSFLHVFEKSSLNVKQFECIEKITTATNSLLCIINNMLDFSKIEANKLQIEETPFNLSSCIYDVHGSMYTLAEEKKISLETSVSDDIPLYVMGDKERLTQVLRNLVSNAIKFTDQGAVAITVTLAKSIMKYETLITFSVSDTGIGISKEAIDHLFQPFASVHTAVSRELGGSGLGLALSQRLVNLMGGTISVESTENEGSVFSFTLSMRPTVASGV